MVHVWCRKTANTIHGSYDVFATPTWQFCDGDLFGVVIRDPLPSRKSQGHEVNHLEFIQFHWLYKSLSFD